MLNILINTPIWVYLLFIFLIYLGISQIKNRKKSFLKALILPFVMILLSFLGLVNDFQINLNTILWYFSGFIVGLIINYMIDFSSNIVFLKRENVFLIKGSIKPFILIMCIFFTKYIVGYLNAIDSHIIHNMAFLIFIPILYGIYNGLFFGRVLSIINKKRKKFN